MNKAVVLKFANEGTDIFVPDGVLPETALRRTTHIGIAAHHDDLEIMAYHGIIACFCPNGYKHPDGYKDNTRDWFTGVVVTDGRGSPRDDLYRDYTAEQMYAVRQLEQKKAAYVGEFSAVVLLDYPSAIVRDPTDTDVAAELINLFTLAQPHVVYTHNLADKHDTHVSVALRVITALRRLPPAARPERVYGCEVWRDLDWMVDEDKIGLDVSAHENLAAALVGVFDSQICGGKRYDLATLGRRRAHATYFASHDVDDTTALTFAMDLTPLVNDADLDIREYVEAYIHRFAQDVRERLHRMSASV